MIFYEHKCLKGLLVIISGSLITLGKPLKGQLYTGKKIYTVEPAYLEGENCLENIGE